VATASPAAPSGLNAAVAALIAGGATAELLAATIANYQAIGQANSKSA
jgi:hypothetical protein